VGLTSYGKIACDCHHQPDHKPISKLQPGKPNALGNLLA